jgi:hypothetical protein
VLWRYLAHMRQEEAIALVENQSDWYVPNKIHDKPFPAPPPRGVNTGKEESRRKERV